MTAGATGMTCPRCGRGTLAPQIVEETITVGNNAVQVTIPAEVCSFCGERWFDSAATTVIDAAIVKLRTGDTTHLTHVGELYRAS
jgi:YgiT-type zinc finger domain-containing protein